MCAVVAGAEDLIVGDGSFVAEAIEDAFLEEPARLVIGLLSVFGAFRLLQRQRLKVLLPLVADLITECTLGVLRRFVPELPVVGLVVALVVPDVAEALILPGTGRFLRLAVGVALVLSLKGTLECILEVGELGGVVGARAYDRFLLLVHLLDLVMVELGGPGFLLKPL